MAVVPSNQYQTDQGQNCGIASPMEKVLLMPSRMSWVYVINGMLFGVVAPTSLICVAADEPVAVVQAVRRTGVAASSRRSAWSG